MSGRRDPRRTTGWRRLRAQCFERDKARNAPCHICGQPIDYSLGHSTCADAYEADHVITVDAHPELALLPENVGASHRRCNRARGKKAGIDNLGRRTRDWRGGKT